MKITIGLILMLTFLKAAFSHDGASDQLALAVIKNSYEPNAIELTVSPIENEYGEERSYEIWRVEALGPISQERNTYRVKITQTYEWKNSKKQQLDIEVNPINMK